MLDSLPREDVPSWLTTAAEAGNRARFDLTSLLNGSLYYPACGFDGTPIRHLAGSTHSFVYADDRTKRADFLGELWAIWHDEQPAPARWTADDPLARPQPPSSVVDLDGDGKLELVGPDILYQQVGPLWRVGRTATRPRVGCGGIGAFRGGTHSVRERSSSRPERIRARMSDVGWSRERSAQQRQISGVCGASAEGG